MAFKRFRKPYHRLVPGEGSIPLSSAKTEWPIDATEDVAVSNTACSGFESLMGHQLQARLVQWENAILTRWLRRFDSFTEHQTS